MGITSRQFEQMQERLGPGRRRGGMISFPGMAHAVHPSAVIMGIDPSLRGTGYGIIQLHRPMPRTLAQGTIRCPQVWPRSRCLALIASTLREAIRLHKPTICVVESLFYAQNLQTALVMGEARGATLVAAAEAGLEIFEIAPRRVKQAMVGFGGAGKLAVARMVQRLLGLAEAPAPDAADALALALVHAQEQGRHQLTRVKPI